MTQRRYYPLVTLALVFALNLFTGSLSSQAKDLLLGVEDIDYYPIYAQREAGYAGFSREFFDAFARKYQHAITYKALPVKRLYSEFINGRLDLKFPDNTRWASDKKSGHDIVYSKGILNYIDGVMVLPENLGRGEARLQKIGTVRGFTPWIYLPNLQAGTIELQENSSLKGLVDLVRAKRIEGAYCNILVARYYLKHTLLEQNVIVFDNALPHSRSAYHVSSIKHPAIIAQINQFLLDEARFVEALKKKYEIDLL